MMKTCQIPLLLAILTTSTWGAPFRNLGFDEGTTNTVQFSSFRPGITYPQGLGPTADLLPGWRIFQGTNELTTLGFNLVGIADTAASLFDENQRPTFLAPEGKFALYLGGFIKPISIVQTGEIPIDAGYMTFNQAFPLFGASINGRPLDVPNRTGRSLYYFVQPYAGQTVELAITLGQSSISSSSIDSIRFVPVPEPSTSALVLFAFVLVLLCCRLPRRKPRWQKRALSE